MHSIFPVQFYKRRNMFKKVKSNEFETAICGAINNFEDCKPYFLQWVTQGFSSPAPIQIKWKVLERYQSGKTWIETGTLWGETTRYLSSKGNKVVTIEADLTLFERASELFNSENSISVIHGTSEDKLNSVVGELVSSGITELSLWLDGHYSGVGTFHGKLDTPIMQELSTIEKYLPKLKDVSIFVDDIRLFNKNNHKHNDYPDLNTLVEWANRNNLEWTIELDIFVATSNNEIFDKLINS